MGGVVTLLRDLVRIPSVNPRDGDGSSEAALASFIANWLESAGLDVRIDEVRPDRPNVTALVPGRDRGRTVMLESHLDTVEVDHMNVPPFDATVADGRLYGRGSCDAKASLAAFMTAVAELAARREPPPLDVLLAAVMDEEHGGLGVRKLLDQQRSVIAAIVGEPTELRLVVAHKGCLRFRVTTAGGGAHSSEPWNGDNAIDRMASVVTFIRDELAPPLAAKPDPFVGPASISVTLITGGAAVNMIPAECTIHLDRRILPGEDPMAVWTRYRQILEGLQPGHIRVMEPDTADGALATDPGSAVARWLGAALRASGLDPTPIGANFGSDANKIARTGIPTVVFGPGSIRDAHRSDESVDLAQVEQAAAVSQRLLRTLPESPTDRH